MAVSGGGKRAREPSVGAWSATFFWRHRNSWGPGNKTHGPQSGNHLINCSVSARKYLWSRDISVGVVSRLQGGRPRIVVRFPARARHFSLLWSVSVGSGVHPASYSVFLSVLTHWGRGHLNCLNARSRGLNNLNQLLYCVSLNIYNKFANYFCELKVSGNTHQRP